MNFEIGDPDAPSGHALVYFKYNDDPDKISATYIIVLPIKLDIERYMPPFLSGQLASIEHKDMSACAIPPVPEEIKSLEWLRVQAEKRSDDLIFGGVVSSPDVVHLMERLNELTQSYASQCRNISSDTTLYKLEEEDSSDSADALIYSLMSEGDLLKESTKLLGQLQFSFDGGDEQMSKDIERRLHVIGRNLPENRLIKDMVDIAVTHSPGSDELALLLLERAYLLYREDYIGTKEIEAKVEELKKTWKING